MSKPKKRNIIPSYYQTAQNILYLVADKSVAGQSLMTNLSADYDNCDGLYAVAVGMNTNLNQ